MAGDDVEIYVHLSDEAVDVWRPLRAQVVAPGAYRLLPPCPEDETWEFGPGEVVRCEERIFEGDQRCLLRWLASKPPSNSRLQRPAAVPRWPARRQSC